MGKYFGTDGFRGEANRTLTAEQAFAIGRFWGARAGERGLVIGRDTRLSSPMLEGALTAGALASGAPVCRMGVISTPGVAYAVQAGHFGGGVMISASHNPYYDNGIKLFDAAGEKPSDGELVMLEAFLDGERVELPHPTGKHVGELREGTDLRKRYFAHLCGAVPGSLQGMCVGLDVANGAACGWAGEILSALGARVYTIHTTPDGCNINRACGSTHPEDLCRLVVERKLDVGFAFDGDADRCIAVDSRGAVVDGDGILYIMACHKQGRGELVGGGVVTTVMSNCGLRQALGARGIACESAAVGDRYVRERMEKTGYLLGGEPSGHVIFGDIFHTGDGVLTALLVATLIRERGPLHKQLQGYTPYPRCMQDLTVSDKTAVMADPALLAELKGMEAALADGGRMLVRASGTEPVVRVMVEAQDLAVCEEYAKRVRKIIEKRGYLL